MQHSFFLEAVFSPLSPIKKLHMRKVRELTTTTKEKASYSRFLLRKAVALSEVRVLAIWCFFSECGLSL